jgi:hypothetical protein
MELWLECPLRSNTWYACGLQIMLRILRLFLFFQVFRSAVSFLTSPALPHALVSHTIAPFYDQVVLVSFQNLTNSTLLTFHSHFRHG